ncbi:WSCD family member GA21586-like isoform X2 [Mercenaria mercenaria]|uniref:WSCD family member GA21586-like isoform X2 n=1 Tax=Mercenaria mercenaria TaxID=6596 RepID=UPI00234F0D30|nr:WSCD family member GA21586-like isoform X2 [Mercenaria mercenaria]
MRKLRKCVRVLLCFLFICTTIVMMDFPNRAKNTINPWKHTAGEDFHENLTFNRTKTTKVFDINAIRPHSVECEDRKSGKFRLSAKELPLTALASPNRSGNAWLRHLLQMATGTGTSSIYCDRELHRKGFPFECDHTNHSRMLVVKTHEPCPPLLPQKGKKVVQKPRLKNPPFYRAVIIIRDPYKILVGNMHKSHLQVFKEEKYFKENSEWRSALPDLLNWWNHHNDYWLTKFRGPVYPLLYSKLLIDTENELKKLLKFLNVTYTESDIRCAMDNKEGQFHRNQTVWTRIKDITGLFDNTLKKEIDASVKVVSELLNTKYGIEWLDENHRVRR